MPAPDDAARWPYRTAIAVVAGLGMYHGAVPLVVRGGFDRDQRLAPALWLPTPWWWIACLAITIAALGIIGVLDATRDRRFPPPERSAGLADPPATDDPVADRASAFDALSGFVFLVGLYNGVAPLVARLVFDSDLLLALPLRLPAPWWWLTSLAVIAASVALLAVIDHAKQRR